MKDKIWTPGGISRRSILKAGAAAGLGLVASPAIVSNAFSSSGEVNFMGWSGYDFKKLFDSFTAKTGIKVNFLEQPDQDSMFAQCKLSLQTGAVDFVEPTVDRVASWVANGIPQPWDETKIKLDNYDQAFVTGVAGDTAKVDGKRYFIPSVWGTEALTYSTTDANTEYGKASLADLFDPKFEGKVVVRAHSSLAAMGRVLDSQGKLPKPFLDSYKDEATMKQIWDIVLAEAIKHKSNIAQFWNGENDAQAAFRTNGCVLGLTWDSTGYNLKKDGLAFGFVAPKEGAFAWLQGYFLMKNAKNTEQAYEFANFVSTADGSALNATAFSANPTGKGGIDKMDAKVTEFYHGAYPGDALSKLWWWPIQDAWFVKLRGEYADKWKAA
ncbi:extracellular solute-binding protein [Labrys wisconsinensis]|uniref:Spermidine/putrescine transport system substrate-binding protein n=1 Tax=Labrys wisconsinensis TaxID=425677 RepID=A0ABU0J3Q5_9HYPH|nr:extracellular solute-binding protein [Labrys wisconsinensis]MDQ0467837.1 spermidine/putrescine transport system substrate-binding protein [Labrys wisconsinensis]